MRKYEFIAMSALLLAAQDPNSDMSQNRRSTILLNNEMAMISGQAPLARTDSSKSKWLKKLDAVENNAKGLLSDQNTEELTPQQRLSLQGTLESIEDMRQLLSPKE